MSYEPEGQKAPAGATDEAAGQGQEVLEAEDLFPPPYPERLARAREWVEQWYDNWHGSDGSVERAVLVRPDGIYQTIRDVAAGTCEERKIDHLPEWLGVVEVTLPFRHEQLIGPLAKIRVAERMQAAIGAAHAALWEYLLSEGAVEDEQKPKEPGP
jgi:hypothetical protein